MTTFYVDLNKKQLMLKPLLFTALVISVCFFSCKKDKIDPNEPPATNDRNELTKDSIFLYARQVYFWNNSLPTYSAFNPRQYNSGNEQLDNFNQVLFKITRYPLNPNNRNLSYEYYKDYPDEPKYSYIDDVSDNGTLAYRNDRSYVDLEGNGFDIGYSLGVVTDYTKYPVPYWIYIRYTYPNSPAAKAGLGRGDYIDQVNGKSYGSNYDAEIDEVADIFNSDPQTIRIGGKRKDGSRFDITLTKANFKSSSVFKDTVITASGKKIGYLAYARFSSDTAILNNKINQFASEGITNLVIDLRYNGGGFVNTSQHLANLIAPSSLNNQTMFAEHYNTTMQQGKASLLQNQYVRDDNVIKNNGKAIKYSDYSYAVSANTYKFKKIGELENIEKLVFLVSDGTASSSELLINNLKPYLDVKLVGSQTYGKPVGFFPIRIDHYDVYLSMFQTKNKDGQGDYFMGMTPDKMQTDDFTRDFGNPDELCFADAIKYITTGSFASTSTKMLSVKDATNSEKLITKTIFSPKQFIGMVENRTSKP